MASSTCGRVTGEHLVHGGAVASAGSPARKSGREHGQAARSPPARSSPRRARVLGSPAPPCPAALSTAASSSAAACSPPALAAARAHLGHERLEREEQQRHAERIGVDVGVDRLHALGQLLASSCARRRRAISSMPVAPPPLRTTWPPVISAICASCSSPSAESDVVMTLALARCGAARDRRPRSSMSGIGSGVRPPICTT